MSVPEPASQERRRANVVGLGLIGGSVALGLRSRGWTVHGDDEDPARIEEAHRRGAIVSSRLDPDATITFVATPVSAIADAAKQALAGTTGLVTDVGSVKGPIAAAVADARFCGGHPMAGSELDGLDGADGALFEGAVWVLTPTAETEDTTFAAVARIVSDLGAEVVALPPDRHDALVAVVSHVPHLAAAALMTVADQRAEEHAALLRLAAGGFRDMTRIAAGQPALWLDICAENRTAIVEALDALVDRLERMRETVAGDQREALLSELTRAREARINLPGRVAHSAETGRGPHRHPRPAGRRRRGVHLGGRARRQRDRLRGIPLGRGRTGRPHPADRGHTGRSVPGGPAGQGLPTVGPPARLRWPPAAPSAPWATRRTRWWRCPGPRASPTGPWSAPPWPAGPARSAASDDPTTPTPCWAASPAWEPMSASTRPVTRRSSWARRASCDRGRWSWTPVWPARPPASSPRWPRSVEAATGSTAGLPLRARPMGPLHAALAHPRRNGSSRRGSGVTCRSCCTPTGCAAGRWPCPATCPASS